MFVKNFCEEFGKLEQEVESFSAGGQAPEPGIIDPTEFGIANALKGARVPPTAYTVTRYCGLHLNGRITDMSSRPSKPALPKLAVNRGFISDFLADDPPCFALGMLEEGPRRCGCVALRFEKAIPQQVLDRGFDLGHCLLGTSTYEV